MADSDNHGNWLLSAMMIIWAWSALMFVVRVWAKLNVKRWGAEDYAVTVAFVVSIMDIGATFWAVKRGYGLPFREIAPEDRLPVARALYASQQFYILAVGFCKISTALFLVHLAYPGRQVKPGYILVGVSGVWTVASMLAIALRGNLTTPWDTLDGSGTLHIRWIVVEITGLLIEILLLLLSISLVNGLHLKLTKRLIILSAFSVRLLLVPLVIVRLYLLSPSVNTDPTYTSIIPNIITEATLNFSVISASITSLRPFLRTFHLDYSTDSKITSKRSVQSTSHSAAGESYYRLDNMNDGAVKKQDFPEPGTENFVGQAVAYPGRTHIHRNGRSSRADTTISEDELLARGSDDAIAPPHGMPAERMVIQKTVNWTIQYEDNNR